MARKADLGGSKRINRPQRFKSALSLARRGQHAVLLGLLLAGLAGASWLPFARAESPGGPALFLKSVNQARLERGAAPLSGNDKLDVAARLQAGHFAQTGQLSHLGSNGERLGQRLQAAGYDYAESAENLASGPAEAARVTALWLASPGHN